MEYPRMLLLHLLEQRPPQGGSGLHKLLPPSHSGLCRGGQEDKLFRHAADRQLCRQEVCQGEWPDRLAAQLPLVMGAPSQHLGKSVAHHLVHQALRDELPKLNTLEAQSQAE